MINSESFELSLSLLEKLQIKGPSLFVALLRGPLSRLIILRLLSQSYDLRHFNCVFKLSFALLFASPLPFSAKFLFKILISFLDRFYVYAGDLTFPA